MGCGGFSKFHINYVVQFPLSLLLLCLVPFLLRSTLVTPYTFATIAADGIEVRIFMSCSLRRLCVYIAEILRSLRAYTYDRTALQFPFAFL